VGCDRVIPPFKKPPGGTLAFEQLRYNRAIQWWRSTIEHVFGAIKHFGILRSVFRGRLSAKGPQQPSGLMRITAAFGLLLQCYNVHTRVSPRRDLFVSTARLIDILTAMDVKHNAGELDGTHLTLTDFAFDNMHLELVCRV
jgi:hypothetical protein